MKNRHSMRKNQNNEPAEEYDIYDNANDTIDEEKITAISQLLTVMNVDNKESESDYSIINTLSSLNKDDFIELQQ